MDIRHWCRRIALAGVGAIVIGQTIMADGREALGPPSIEIADGTDFVIGGVGLLGDPDRVTFAGRRGEHQDAPSFTSHSALPHAERRVGAPTALLVDVPLGVSIEQVLLYWEGQSQSESEVGPTDTITLDPGGIVTGDRIGGPTFFFDDAPIDYWTATYRADITPLGIITSGLNSIDVSGLDFTSSNDGAGIVVIIDDGFTNADVQIADGNDAAWGLCPGAANCGTDDAGLATTTPVVFEFASAPFDRVAKLGGFWGSVALEGPGGQVGRPTIIRVTTGGRLADFNDLLDNNVGPEWDAHILRVNVRAGATSLSVQSLSEDSGAGPFAGNLVASMVWTTSIFSLGAPEEPGACCVEGTCLIVTAGECAAAGGEFLRPGTNCDLNPCGCPPPSIECRATQVDDDDHGGSGLDDHDHDDDDDWGGGNSEDDDHSNGGDDDGTLFLIEFDGSSNCAEPLRITGVIDIGCELIPIESGQLVSVSCSSGDGFALDSDDDDDHSGNDDGDDDDAGGDECESAEEDGVIVIHSIAAVLIVTATDAVGQRASCSADLCEASGDGDDDDDHSSDDDDDDHGGDDDDDDHSGEWGGWDDDWWWGDDE